MQRRKQTTPLPVTLLAPIEELPHEIQCLFFKDSLTYYDVIAIRESSSQLKRAIDDCVEIILPPPDGIDVIIPAQLILSLERIRSVPMEHPIVISRIDELIKIASKEFLVEATFDLTDIIKKPEEIYTLVQTFFDNFITPGPDCTYCNNNSYNFVFYNYHQTTTPKTKNIPPKLQLIHTYEGGLTLIDTPNTPKLESFLRFIVEQIPVCHYNGAFWPRVRDVLLAEPCLRQITYRLPVRSYGTTQSLQSFLNNPNITDYYASYPKQMGGYAYVSSVSNLISYISRNGHIYSHITTFLPIPWDYIDVLQTSFPNLIDIYLTITDLLKYSTQTYDFQRLQRYDKIIIVDHNPKIHQETYDEILTNFPLDLQSRVLFIPSE